MNKKGQLVSFSSMPSIAITMLVVTMLVVIGAILLAAVKTENTLLGDETRVIVNETISIGNATNTSLIVSGNIDPGANDQPGVAGQIVDGSLIITNASDGTTLFDNTTSPNLGAGNFSTIDLVHAVVNLTAGADGIGFNWTNSNNANISYSYDVPQRSSAYNITTQGEGFFDNLSSQFPLLGTIIILVLVIVVVIAGFAFRGGGRRGKE